MSKPRLVLISGKKNSGKNLLGEYLGEGLVALGYKPVFLAFADPVKDAVSIMINCTREELEELKNSNQRVRELLQIVGTECGRTYSEDIWVNNLRTRLSKVLSDPMAVAIVPDCRFKNEATSDYYVVNRGETLLLRVEREGLKNTGYHKSEIDLDTFESWDCIIANNGTKKDLKTSTEAIIAEFWA